MRKFLVSTLVALMAMLGIPSGANAAPSLIDPEILAETKSKVLDLDGFASKSSELTTSMKREIRDFLESSADYAYLDCVGYVSNAATATDRLDLAMQRAENVCEYAIKVSPEIMVQYKEGFRNSARGVESRKTALTLYKALYANITYKAPMGEADRDSDRVLIGSGAEVVLPSATRYGYTIESWMTKEGVYVGSPGATIVPTKSMTLYAEWSKEEQTPSDSEANSGDFTITVASGIEWSWIVGIWEPSSEGCSVRRAGSNSDLNLESAEGLMRGPVYPSTDAYDGTYYFGPVFVGDGEEPFSACVAFVRKDSGSGLDLFDVTELIFAAAYSSDGPPVAEQFGSFPSSGSVVLEEYNQPPPQ